MRGRVVLPYQVAGIVLTGIAMLAVSCSSGGGPSAVHVDKSLTRCTTATAAARELSGPKVALTMVNGPPFGIVAAREGTAFVSAGSQVGTYQQGDSGRWSLTSRVNRKYGLGLGEALTANGRYVLVANAGNGAYVLAVHGRELAPAGMLRAPAGSSGAIEVAVTADGRFAFVSLETSDRIAVFALGRALADGFGLADYVGSIPAGVAPAGLAISPDGRWLYFTSEFVHLLPNQAAAARTPGTVSVVSVSKAESDPAHAVVATVTAGCQPVRVVTSASGAVVWVTARASDAVLGFSAERLRTDPRHALIAAVRVGEAPVGLALVRGGARIVVADSNRFDAPAARATLAVVSVPAALAGRRALLGYLPAGRFPRDMAVVPGGRTLLISDYGSSQLEAVPVASLP